MVLKSIEMKGFKSFPHKTQLSFPEGIVSIIGPNGSGKSNVLDAVRWVLGEKSAKNLRGDKMEDVIFSGTKIHKSMNFCEVEIVFENEDQFLNIDFHEVSIKRKAYRNGESKYYINGSVCRQKDIKELLLDSGIGKEGYSIISQGRIDEIINSNPVQRRRIFEEACNISKNRYQKEESERKLDTVKENLERINDIYGEIEKQIKPLKHQSENAKMFIELRNALVKSDVNRIVAELEKIQEEYDELKVRLESKNESLSALETELSVKTEKENQLNTHVEELYVNIERLVENKNKLSLERGHLENEIATNKLFLENHDKQSQKSAEQIEKANEKVTNAKSEFEMSNMQLEALRLELDDFYKELGVLEDEEKTILKEEDEILRKIENLKDVLIGTINQKNIIKSQINQFKQEQNLESKKVIDFELLQKNQQLKIETLERKLLELKKAYENKQVEIEKILNVSLEMGKQISLEENQIVNVKTTILELDSEIKTLSSKKAIFDEMEAHYEGMSNSVKEVLKEKSLDGIVDILANIIHVDLEYEKAIEAALGGAIQNIVTKTSEWAKEAIDFLKKKKLGRATFLPMDAIKGQELKIENTIIASSVVDVIPEYKSIVKQLLGKTIIVNTMDEGIRIAKLHDYRHRIVTKDGEIFNSGGAITGGAYVRSSNILSRKREIQSLKEEIEKASKKKMILETELTEDVTKLCDLRESKTKLDQQIEALKKTQESLNMELIDEKNRISYEQVSLENILKEASQIKCSQDANTIKLEELERQVEEIELNILSQQSVLDEHIKTSNKNKAWLVSQGKKIIDKREQSLVNKVQLENGENILKEKEVFYKEQSRIYQEYLLENRELLENLKNSETKLIELEKALVITVENLTLVEEQTDKIRQNHVAAKERLVVFKENLKVLEQTRFMEMDERYQLENKLTKVEGIIENSLTKLLEEYNMSLEEGKKLVDKTVDTSKAYISKIKSNISALGNVNLDSIEEYEKTNERYMLFLTQKTDLELSLFELEKITANIEKSMRKEFKQEFSKINELFKTTFKELFGGGEGELVLADEDDILNCEIEIHAQPPGKKLKSISVMSGGEKALTAIAILFAILMTKPTPFCFLDEIDAPLDDVNIYRYNKYIQSLAMSTQFITITHRRGTMEASDYIYGVTMEDKGVSKIISLKLEEADNYIEN